MNSDFHIHTEFSCDTDADMELYVKRAIQKEIKHICFTEHVDLNEVDFGYQYYTPEPFWKKFENMRALYGEKLNIYAGIEIGEPHLYEDELKRLSKYPYDFIIGSIHWIGTMFPSPEIREQYSAKEFYTWYWDEVLKTVKYGEFDALGHMDFPKRYYGEIYYKEEKMKEIFRHLLEKERVIEINTSTLRKGLEETMPGDELLQVYRDCGGRFVTIGSDSHDITELGMGIEKAKRSIKVLGLQEVIYENRKRKTL